MMVRGTHEAHYNEAPEDIEARVQAGVDEAKQLAKEIQDDINAHPPRINPLQ